MSEPVAELLPAPSDEWPRLRELEVAEWDRKAFGARYFERAAHDPESVVAVVRDAGAIVGFMIATRDPNERSALYIEDTLVDPAHRGRGLVGALSRVVEDEARRRGYAFLTRDAAIGNGYADAIERAYAGRVLVHRDHGSPYGRQRYLRIRL